MAGSVDKNLRAAKAKLKGGAYAEAEAIYRAVLARFPGNKRAQADLVELQRLRGTQLRPPPQALLGELFALHSAGRFRELVAASGRALTQFPRAPALLELRAAGLSALGDHVGAAALLREVVAMFPDQPAPRGNLGNELLALGDDTGAEAQFTRLLELRPDDPATLTNLGLIRYRRGDMSGARAAYSAALAAAPGFAQAHLNLATALSEDGELTAAADQLAVLLRHEPANATALTRLGSLHLAFGDRAAARQAFDAAIAARPDDAEAHRLRAQLHRFGLGDPELAALQALLDRPQMSESDRMLLEFAMGKAQEDLGDPAAAFNAFAAANARRKAALGYDIAQDRALFAQIKAAFAAPPPAIPDPQPDGPEPIFILGMPRSGSTLVEQIVSAHPQVAAGGEIETLDAALAGLDWTDATALGQAGGAIRAAYRDRLARAGLGAAFVTDKMPGNFRWVGAIKALFPAARIVHVRRDPRAVLWSNFRHYFPSAALGYGHDLGDLAAYHGLYADLMAHWHALFPGAILDLDYDALTEDPATRIPALIAGLGLPWDDACLRPQDNAGAVRTASNQQVRQPIYRGSSDTWRRYAAQIGTVFDVLS